MINIKGQVLGSEKVEATLGEAAVGYSQRVPKTVKALGLDLLAKVKEQYLSGSGALNVRSGRLRRSITEASTEDGTTFASSVGSNLAYARFWELGFHGLEEVKAYMRRTGKHRVNLGPYTTKTGKTRNKWVTEYTGAVPVRAHSRQVDQDARPFLQPALADMKDEIRARLKGAIEGK